MKKEATSMPNIVKWDPMSEIVGLRDTMNRLFESSFLRSSEGTAMFQPPMDVVEGENEITVTLDVPGFKSEDVEVNVTEDLLTIRGKMSEDREEAKRRYHLRERRYSEFGRSLAIPNKIKPDRATATFRNGVLTVTLPKTEEVKTRSVQVRVE
jgi:HSP20 family protein